MRQSVSRRSVTVTRSTPNASYNQCGERHDMRSWHVTENYVSRHANAQILATRLRLAFSHLSVALRKRLASTADGSVRPMQGLLTPATVGKSEAIHDGLIRRGHPDPFTGDSAWAIQELPSIPSDPVCIKDFTDVTPSSQRSPCHRHVLLPATYCKCESCDQFRSLTRDIRYTDGITIYSGADININPIGQLSPIDSI